MQWCQRDHHIWQRLFSQSLPMWAGPDHNAHLRMELTSLLVVQASTNTLLSHFVSMLSCLWIIRVVGRNSTTPTAGLVPATGWSCLWSQWPCALCSLLLRSHLGVLGRICPVYILRSAVFFLTKQDFCWSCQDLWALQADKATQPFISY